MLTCRRAQHESFNALQRALAKTVHALSNESIGGRAEELEDAATQLVEEGSGVAEDLGGGDELVPLTDCTARIVRFQPEGRAVGEGAPSGAATAESW